MNGDVRRNGRHFLYPLGFAVAPVMTFLSNNVQEALAGDVAATAALVLSVALAVEVLFALALRSPLRGSLPSAVLFAAFFSYGALIDRIPLFRFMFLGIPIGPNKVLYLAVAALLIGAALFAWKGSAPALQSVSRVLTVLSVALVVSSAATLGYAVATVPRTSDELSLARLEGAEAAGAAAKPDIYYIILDGYLGTEALREATGYDNTPFIAELEDRGFEVAEGSHSNYYNTDESVLSILNMQYLSELEAQLDERGRGWDAEYLARNNVVMRRLKEAGYQTVVVRSPYGPLARVRGADVILDPASPYVNELTANLLKTTILRAFSTSGLGIAQRQRILAGFDLAAKTVPLDSPKCVFVHLLVPHQPFAFDKDGGMPRNEIVYSVSGSAEEREGYAEQARYTNDLTIKLLDSLLEDARARSAIVVVQGDHGARFGLEHARPWEGGAATAQQFEEYFSVLNAFRFPDGAPAGLHDSISSVNTFRLVLNEALGTGYPLLEDKSFGYRTEAGGRLTDVVDVTERLETTATAGGAAE